MPVSSCIPIIPSANLEKSLRLWVDGFGFSMSSEMHEDDKLIFCMLRKDDLSFMLNQRMGTLSSRMTTRAFVSTGAKGYTRNQRAIKEFWGYDVSELEHREYGQTEFVLTDDDGYSHCFGVPTKR